jgi:PfaB family protein
MHVVLEGFDYSSMDNLPGQIQKKVLKERKRPLGDSPYGLFLVEGDSNDSLIEGLDSLLFHINRKPLTVYENIEPLARSWYLENKPRPDKKYALSITSKDISGLKKLISKAKDAVLSDTPQKANGSGGIHYSLNPLGLSAETAFVFPGSGNHYVSMGRGIGVQWPDILRRMDAKTLRLKTQLLPGCFVPQRISWSSGWEKDARDTIISDPLHMIFGQVAHGGVVSGLMKYFELKPSAVIGYSLGESAGLFAMGAWPDRGQMLKRMQSTDLFTTSLAGPCNAARKAWGLSRDEDVNWCVAVVNRSADNVRKVIRNWPTTRLLIINTPDECVIGGREIHVKAAIKMLDCEAFFLDGVVTIHCDAAAPVAEAYKALHIFPTTQIDGTRFYSCAYERSYDLSSESTASSILKQALSGFDFPATIKQAYHDGVRIFLEMGPNSSCTRMINKILKNKPHLAASACVNGEDDYITILNVLSVLAAERVPVDLDKLYGNNSYPSKSYRQGKNKVTRRVSIIIGGKSPTPILPTFNKEIQKPETGNQFSASRIQHPDIRNRYSDLMRSAAENIDATSKAHQEFLDFSSNLTKNFAKTFSIQTRLLETVIKNKGQVPESEDGKALFLKNRMNPEPAFSRDQCMEFATGSIERILGPEFAVVDTYKARVRLPDDPLMLVDRIISVEGKKGSLGHGRVVTEHDVLPDAWYLDGGHAPVCISVEAGQADLFLCSYLGIDLVVKGERTYRLLDANVVFHTGLPQPGDTIRYKIEIEKFVRQGDTYLFFFNFEGRIGNTLLITMSKGCAGFFTEDEVVNSGGIILTDEDSRPLKGKKNDDWKDLVELYHESYNDDAVQGLREGNLSKCFGMQFKGMIISESLRLPGSRMKLIDRILSLDPDGGRYGLGSIRAQADIHPDDWFLTCHFKDDMVMPGTLMYECCAHTLRIFIQRIGWVTDKPDVFYEPVTGIESVLKCRGPVTPKTNHVIYEVDIKELGYKPEPYVIADANMYADGHHIVMFKDLSMKMTGITRTEIESFWEEKSNLTSYIQQPVFTALQPDSRNPKPATRNTQHVLFDRNHIIEFATGKPSLAFGDKYKPFDSERFIARLPAPPYSFIDRITSIEPKQWLLEPDGWVETECDVNPDAWFFKANRTPSMPYCIINEIALQPCGWLAAYMGIALKSQKDLRFRNLGGNTTLYQNILPAENTLTTRTRLTQVSRAGDMTIEQFDLQIYQSGVKIYEGDTSFGFFTQEALAIQTGIRGGAENAYVPGAEEIKNAESFNIKHEPPFAPYDKHYVNDKIDRAHPLSMPAKAVLMLDQIDMYIPEGGSFGLGFIRGTKKVDPDEWFFKAHFFQDPVCPGSLGIESFLQLIRFIAIKRFKHLEYSHSFELLTKTPHSWIYRGQILPGNEKIEVEAVVTKISDKPNPEIYANGYLKVDGLYIYKMDNFGIRLVPIK